MGNPVDDTDPFESAARIPRPTNQPVATSQPTPARAASRGRARGDQPSSHPKKTSSYWDRPAPTRDWHWFLGRLGSSLIVAGLLVFLFVGYQLWGTGIEAAQSQQRLESTFGNLANTTESTMPPEPESPNPEPIIVAHGDPLALIEIPAIGVSKYVVAGVETADLKKGPGHYPNTPLPGELGNVAIAGHRTTYGEPFRHLDQLVVGDSIVITDLAGRRFTYLVTGQQIVSPKDSWVVDTVDPSIATLTLTTCHPEFSAKQRLIVSATLDTSLSDVASFPAATYGREASSTIDSTTPSTTAPDSGTPNTVDDIETVTGPATSSSTGASGADVFDKGWFSDPKAVPHVIAWTLLDVLIVLAAWQIAKRLRNRAIGVAVGIVPFFVVLYFVFQNVNRLLPPNL